MSRSSPKESVVKRLFALSGNQCAFPGCIQQMVSEDGVLGEICHIESANPNGERYNTASNDEQRRSFENLILLCSAHHVVTNNVNEYSSLKLREFKLVHENKFLNNQYHPSESIVKQAIQRYMDQKNTNTGKGYQFNNQAEAQGAITQIGEQHHHHYHRAENVGEKTPKKTNKYVRIGLPLILLVGVVALTFIGKAAWEKHTLKKIIHAYFQDMNTEKFQAENYFAPQIERYILVKNYTPRKLDSLLSKNYTEFLARSSKMDESSFCFSRDVNGNNTVQFWIKFNCFRKSKSKYQNCLVHEEFVFNANNKIISVRELEIKGLEYSFTNK
jgi:hypothetical protein